MGWWRRRRETLNEKLMREAGLTTGEEAVAARATEPSERMEPQPPSSDPALAGRWGGMREAGLTGIPRLRQWDAMSAVEAPGLKGDEIGFEALPDGSLLVEEEIGEASLAPLAEGIEQTLSPPYRARAVRQGETTWAVAAKRIEVVELPDNVLGEEIDLAVHRGEKTLVVDGRHEFGSVPLLEQLAAARFEHYAVHAERLDGNLWEVRVSPL